MVGIAAVEGESLRCLGKAAFDAAQCFGAGEHETFSSLAFGSSAVQYQPIVAAVNLPD